MHYLHKILVPVDSEDYEDLSKFQSVDPERQEELKENAMSSAINAIDEYGDGRVWDWHSDGPGSWSNDVPEGGVLLGAEDPEAFLKKLEEARKGPLESALESLKHATEYYNDGKPIAEVDDKFITGIFEHGEFGDAGMLAYTLSQALRLASGRYHSDSYFYVQELFSTKMTGEYLEQVKAHPENYALAYIDLHN